MQDPFKLGEKLRQFRVHFNYTQEYVAARLGVPKSTFCEYEKGLRRIPDQLVLDAARLFGVDETVFFTTAPLKLGKGLEDIDRTAARVTPETLRSFQEREQKLMEFMNAQTAAMNEQMAVMAQLLREKEQ